MLAPGSYIAGFVFEQSGRPDIAIRYYDEALGQQLFHSLEEPVARLVAATGYKGEFTAKLLKRGYHIEEVPITYRGRSRREGKKINWKDGVKALWYLLKYRVDPWA
mgnify:CR=1 FL=1